MTRSTSRSGRTRACGVPDCRSGWTTPYPHRDQTRAGSARSDALPLARFPTDELCPRHPAATRRRRHRSGGGGSGGPRRRRRGGGRRLRRPGRHRADGPGLDLPDSIFRIASVSKPVTAAAVLAPVEDGRLALHAPAEEWLPEPAKPTVPGS
ncbi:serine hydrolase [Streptomyces hokutonensis]|uniref:serine hydrolase n=1 Tax=Streptomyces hokutonensis TaxID=1306990 RepID=UPI003F6F41AE